MKKIKIFILIFYLKFQINNTKNLNQFKSTKTTLINNIIPAMIPQISDPKIIVQTFNPSNSTILPSSLSKPKINLNLILPNPLSYKTNINIIKKYQKEKILNKLNKFQKLLEINFTNMFKTKKIKNINNKFHNTKYKIINLKNKITFINRINLKIKNIKQKLKIINKNIDIFNNEIFQRIDYIKFNTNYN